MNKMKCLFFFSMLMMATIAFGQGNEKKVSKIAKGTVLTDADLGFLSLVSNATLESSRGSGPLEATVSGKTYKVGQALTKADATSLNSAIMAFRKTNPGEKNPTRTAEAARGALCYYWYYYCDGYGTCWWYKYWYYC